MVSEVSLFLQRIIPGGHPIGNNCFFCSDLRTFRASFFYPYCSINLQLNPPYPLKQKREQIERVLKGKLFINTIQPSNSPTMKNILKCNSLLYSSIYIVFNYIYYYTTVVLLDAVGRVGLTIFNRPTVAVQQKQPKRPFVGRVGHHPTVFSSW